MVAKPMYSIVFCLALTLVVGSGANADLVGWWKLDGSAVDSSDNGHDGVLFGDPEWVEGIVDGALKCDGVDDRIEMPGTSAAEGFAGLAGEVTWTMWMKTPPSAATQTIMAQGPAGAAHVQGNRSINVEVSGVIMMRAHSVAALTSLNSTAVVNDDQWHHVAVTVAFDTDGASDTMKVYIDGDLSKGYEADTVNINQHAGVAADFIVTLGDRAGSPFGGLIDDVRVYDHILNVVELRGVMLGEPYPFAVATEPEDGVMIDSTVATLQWLPGQLAASHLVYFSESFDEVNEGLVEPVSTTDEFLKVGMAAPYAGGLTPGQTYYWRVDEVDEANSDSPWKGEVLSFWVRPAVAWDPTPVDEVKFVHPEQDLAWEPGMAALFHTVYFGESFLRRGQRRRDRRVHDRRGGL